MNRPYHVLVRGNCVYVDGRWMFHVRVWEDTYPEGRFVVLTYYRLEYLEPVLDRLKNTATTCTIFPVCDSRGYRHYDAYAFGCRTCHDVRVLMNELGPRIGPTNAGLSCIFPVRHGKHDELVRMGCSYRVVLTNGDTCLSLGNGEGEYQVVGDLYDFDSKAVFAHMFRLEKPRLYLLVGIEDVNRMLEDAV